MFFPSFSLLLGDVFSNKHFFRIISLLSIELNQSMAYFMVHSHAIRPNENVFAVDLKENVFNILTLTLFE